MPRTKSFKKWNEELITLVKTEVSQRISSKQGTITRYNQKLDEVKKSRSFSFEGLPREDYIGRMAFEVRRLKGDMAKENTIVKTLEERIENSILLKKKMMDHPLIDKVWISSGDLLKVKTKLLRSGAVGGGKIIGAYEIAINPRNKAMTIRNITHFSPSRPELAHWAVSNGKPCMGEWADGFMSYMRNYEFFLLTDSVIRFLSSAGDNNAYQRKTDWMKALKEKNPEDRDKPDAEEDSEGDDGIDADDLPF